MRIKNLKDFSLDAFKSLLRNKTISIASIVTVVITLIIYGIFSIIMQTISLGISNVQTKFEVKIYLRDEITQEEKTNIENKLAQTEGVAGVVFESKNDALKNFKEKLQDYVWMVEGYDTTTNPLPSSYIVKLEGAKYSKVIVQEFSNMPGVEDVLSDQALAENIQKIAYFIRIVWIILTTILIVVSLFLISNTIKLTVYSRRREVYIMKFVGATDWFIRWPFVIEGIIIGVVGAVIAVLTLFYSYNGIFSYLANTSFITALINPSYVIYNLSIQFILIGIIVGIVGSLLSLRKFLKV